MNVELIRTPGKKSTKHTIKRAFRACVLIRLYQPIPWIGDGDIWRIHLDESMLELVSAEGDILLSLNISKHYDKICRSGKFTEALKEIETGIYRKYSKYEKENGVHPIRDYIRNLWTPKLIFMSGYVPGIGEI